LFRLLMSCNTNDRPIDLPPSIVLATPKECLIEEDDILREVSCEAADELDEVSSSTSTDIDISAITSHSARTLAKAHPRLSVTMPSSHVVEISQTFYWPLYSKPIDWIYQQDVVDTWSDEEMNERTRRVAELLNSLEFSQSVAEEDNVSDTQQNMVRLMAAGATSDEDSSIVASTAVGDVISQIMEELLEVKEDWFSDLSGGQKSKVELVRKVFLMDECPHVLLIDETMAPLDPRSKSLVMTNIKSYCSGSVVIVIYHTDVGREQEAEGGSGELVECVPSNDFFDGNIHVENKMMHLRPVC